MSKYLFVHVPKTAGQSILSLLNERELDPWNRVVHAKHDPYFVLQRNNKIDSYVFSFAVVRNPYRRTFSYFKHFCKHNRISCKFKHFLNAIKDGVHYERTPMITFTQSFYCLDEIGDISLSKIYKHENLHEMEKDLNISLPHLNKGNYSEEEYFESYTEENKNFVRDYYSSDFCNFNYCLDFV
jgi:hypothetical protein